MSKIREMERKQQQMLKKKHVIQRKKTKQKTKLREEKLSGKREEETQLTKVAKPRKNEDKSLNQEKVSNNPNTSNKN